MESINGWRRCKQIAEGVAAQFGNNCEVVIHDVAAKHPDHSIVIIENGHVSGRKVGDGASHDRARAARQSGRAAARTICATSHARRTARFSKSSSIYIRGEPRQRRRDSLHQLRHLRAADGRADARAS